MAFKKGDFLELEYTGKVKDGDIFDTTQAAVAKEAGLNPKATYKPVIICLGQGHLLRGIDTFLEGKEPDTYTIELRPEEAFGKKNPKLLKLIPLQKFKESKVQPFIGMEVNVDNTYGVVRSISGGRVTVDFNHPMAGKELVYEVTVKRVVTDTAEQVAALLELAGVHHHGVTMEGEKHAVIKMHGVPPQPMAAALNKMITELTIVETVSYETDSSHDH